MKMSGTLIVIFSPFLTTSSAFSQSQYVEHWLEVNNKVVRPGESVVITLWSRLVPGPDQPTTYSGFPATVKYLYHVRMNMVMSTTVDGNAISAAMNNSFFYDNNWNKSVGNSMYNYDGHNLSFSNPTKDNPLWVAFYVWKPEVYENAIATVTVDDPKYTVAVEVPALGKFFPQCVFYKWTEHKIAPVEFAIRDTPCIADCNDDDELNIDDFICFTTNYSLGTYTAGTDCDLNNKLNIDDFICFQTNFVLGC
jgi:hypothetical protein